MHPPVSERPRFLAYGVMPVSRLWYALGLSYQMPPWKIFGDQSASQADRVPSETWPLQIREFVGRRRQGLREYLPLMENKRDTGATL